MLVEESKLGDDDYFNGGPSEPILTQNDSSVNMSESSKSNASSNHEDRRYMKGVGTKTTGKFKTAQDRFGLKDIFFALFNQDVNSLEPLVYGFQKEADILLNLCRELSTNERLGTT